MVDKKEEGRYVFLADYLSNQKTGNACKIKKVDLDKEIKKEDVFNYKGDSLFELIQGLWKYTNSVDLDKNYREDILLSYIHHLYTFRLKDIARMMPDSLRNKIVEVFHFNGYFYTNAVARAAERLYNEYPYLADDLELLVFISEKLDRINQKHNSEIYNDVMVLRNAILKMNTKYLWLIYKKVYRIFDVMLPTVEVRTFIIIKEILQYFEIKGISLVDLNDNIVIDVTTILHTAKPHPELYLAAKRAYIFLKSIYTSYELSGVFIYDVYSKLSTYLADSRYALTDKMIEVFETQVMGAVTDYDFHTDSECYKLLIESINKFSFNKNEETLVTILHGYTRLASLSYQDTLEFPDFVRVMKKAQQILSENKK